MNFMAVPFISRALVTFMAFYSALAWSAVERAAVPDGEIEHILVIDLENEHLKVTFGPESPAAYLNRVLIPQGELIEHYYGTSHLSLGNYIAQVSGQGTNPALNNDGYNPLTGMSEFKDITPGTSTPNPRIYPGQVVGEGSVFPAPSPNSHGAQTIGEQLDAAYPYDTQHLNWRAYAEDMGNDPNRDLGVPDPLGGMACAHPSVGSINNPAYLKPTENDQFALKHVPFLYFHSVIDDQTYCEQHVVPLGTIQVGSDGKPDVFSGHLYEDLKTKETTPRFLFVTPNLCNDGHDHHCVGLNIDGTHEGGLVAADHWLQHWMPLILNSPAYKSGKMLVVITFDEAGFDRNGLLDTRICHQDNQADCLIPPGLNLSNPGFSPVLGTSGLQSFPNHDYQYAGGGQVGAVLLNAKWIKPGTINQTGDYNHYSALRSYEDLLGLHSGGDDGDGHLGFAALPGLKPFGKDVFNQQAE